MNDTNFHLLAYRNSPVTSVIDAVPVKYFGKKKYIFLVVGRLPRLIFLPNCIFYLIDSMHSLLKRFHYTNLCYYRLQEFILL